MANRRFLPLYPEHIHDLVKGGGLLLGEEMEEKKCGHCWQTKELSNFYLSSKRGKQVFSSWCKQCYKNKERTPEKRQVRQAYYASELGKEKASRFRKSTKGKAMSRKMYSPLKRSAHYAVKKAVSFGKLPHVSTLFCKDCNNTAEVYHHWSYEKQYQLDVIPLCCACHRKIHGVSKKIWVT